MAILKSLISSSMRSQCIRNASTLSKLSNLYRNLWAPECPKPPYCHVCQVGDPVLRQKALPVGEEDLTSKGIAEIVKIMKDVMKKHKAIGLSAPQIGLLARIIAVEFPESSLRYFSEEVIKSREMVPIPFKVFINPVMTVTNPHKVVFPEGCESIKGMSASVARYREVTITGYDSTGKQVEWHAKGWPARIIQHEMDHLDGKLYVDIMDPKTFQFDQWYRVNARSGKFKLNFSSF